jgi:serine/threonine protein kinase/WD40 repeat protein
MNDPLREDDPTQVLAAGSRPRSAGNGDQMPTPRMADVSETGGRGDLPCLPGYEVLGVLGQGGMGIVYRGRHLALDRPVALKVLRGPTDSGVALARFRREAAVMARLAHPGVVQVYELGVYREGGVEKQYIAFELVGPTSLDRLLRQSVLPSRQAAELVLSLARTLQAVHEAGIVHRDLKPGNVLLSCVGQAASLSSSEGQAGSLSYEPKITDFGLAQLRDETDQGLTRADELLGTPGYMAPEQIESGSRSVGPAADLHALGAILYECLTGRPPFKGASLHETLEQITRHEPASVRRLVPGVPRDLETICLKCLEKEPTRRYGSAGELADDLGRFLEGRTIRARPLSPVGRLWRWCRRQPLTAALIALALLLLGGLGAAAAWYPAQLAAERGAAAAARVEAEAAREVGATHRYGVLVAGVELRAANREPDWPSRGLADLARAARLGTRVRDPVLLRSRAADCLGAVDVAAAKRLPAGMTASRLAFDPTRPVLALGQAKGWLSCEVVLLDIPGGKVRRRLTFPSVRLWVGRRLVQDGVTALTFSPDGRWLVAGSRGGRLHRWDLGQPHARAVSWAGHGDRAVHLSFSPEGDALFSAGEDRTVRRWAVSEGWKQTHQLATSDFPSRPVCLGRGSALLVGDGPRVHHLRPADLTPLRPASPAPASQLAGAADTGLAAVAAGPSVWLYDPATGRPGHRLTRPGLDAAHDGLVEDLAFSPDGSLLVSASEQTRNVHVWEITSGRLLAGLPLIEGSCRVAFAAGGRWLALLAGREVHLHEVRRSGVQTLAALQVQPVHAACWLGQEELACIAGERWQGEGSLGIHPIDRPGRAPRLRRSLHLPEARLPVRLAVDGARRALAWTEHKAVVRAELPGLSISVRRAVDETHGLGFAPPDRLWLTDSLHVRCCQGEQMRPGVRWTNALSDVLTGRGSLLTLAAGRRRVLAGGHDGVVRQLDPDRGKVAATWRLSAGPVCSLALDGDEVNALAGTWDGSVRLLHLPSGRSSDLPGRHRDRVGAVAFLGRDAVATGGSDGTVRLYRRQGEEFQEWLSLPARAPVLGLSATRDGRRLAVVLAGERAVRIWHLDRLQQKLNELGMD